MLTNERRATSALYRRFTRRVAPVILARSRARQVAQVSERSMAGRRTVHGVGGTRWDMAPAGAWPVLAASRLAGHLVGGCGQEAGVPFGLGGEGTAVAFGGEVKQGPQFAEPVEGEKARGVVFPAGGEDGGELAVAGPVDVLDPAPQPVYGRILFGAVEFPPSW